MKFILLKSKKFWWRCLASFFLLPLGILCALLVYINTAQDSIIQGKITELNEQHQGVITVGDTHVSLFSNFPDISIKVDDVRIYETKSKTAPVILDVKDIYVGFNLWNIINGNYSVRSLLVEDGFFDIVLHADNTMNIENALKPFKVTESTEEPLDFNLKKIKFVNLDIHKKDEAEKTDLETFIHQAEGGFKMDNEFISAHIDTEFEMNLIDNGDTTYIRHKHFELHSDVVYDQTKGILNIKPSRIIMEHGDFDLAGTIDTKNEVDLDLSIKGTKPNFDMLIAFAPEEIIPILERYNNAGNIYFNAIVQGPTLNQKTPFFSVNFGASEAYLENTTKGKRVNNMGFTGHFTNGQERNLRTTTFSLKNMTAKLETGNFLANIVVTNFEEPEVDMQLNADFNLAFMTDFLNITDIEKASGKVSLKMNFHDIIDLDQPELALNQLNQAYFTALKVEDLSIYSKDLPAPLEKLNAHLVMNGKEATLSQFTMLMGKSDISVTGFLSDLPAVVHQLNTPVVAHLEIKSNVLDIAELTRYSKLDSMGIDEKIEKLSAGFSFKSSASAFSEAKYLPKGEFFVDSLHANLKHYPHELHDFHVDFLIDDEDLKIVDFTGFIDDSDFHLNGLVHNYGFWMQDELNGAIDLDIGLTSELMKLEDIFTYQGENYVPEEYRHEEFNKLAVHVNSSMHFKGSELHAIDVDLDKLTTKMKLHPLRFERFTGGFQYKDEHLVVKDFIGKIGRTSFNVNMNYYLGANEAIKKQDNFLDFKANYIDYDQLFPATTTTEITTSAAVLDTADVKEHAEAFNLYKLPFTAMKFNVDVDFFMFQRIVLEDIKANLRTTPNHYIYVDTLTMNAAGGTFTMNGYFNGSDPKHIYMKPNIVAKNVAIDKFLFKFENFGQDHVVSENLKGRVSTKIDGKIRIYPDLVPDLDQSEVHMDVEVHQGKLQNYGPMALLSDYMGDKNLKNVKFDTLKNHIDITNGKITIPNMTIESTLGHMELSGTQDMDLTMEYYLRIPWKTVKQSARYKLFANKNKETVAAEEEIVELDPNENVRYLNVKLHGTTNDFKVSLQKAKKDSTK